MAEKTMKYDQNSDTLADERVDIPETGAAEPQAPIAAKRKPFFKHDADGLVVTGWMNPGKEGKFFPSVNIKRKYHDDERGEWVETSSMGEKHIDALARVLPELMRAIKAEKKRLNGA